MIKRILKLLAILAVVAIFVVAAGLVGLVVGRSQNLTLPPPAGAYAVRRFITTWTDEARLENLGGTPGQHRTLSVWIWYPAEPGGVAVPYMPPDWARPRGGPWNRIAAVPDGWVNPQQRHRCRAKYWRRSIPGANFRARARTIDP